MNVSLTGDLKVFLIGACFSLAAGLSLGGAMQPHLDAGDDRPAGPQLLADGADQRSTGPDDASATVVSDLGRTPDYVMGTDWKKAMAWPDERAAVSVPREVAPDDPPPAEAPAVLTRVAYEPPAPHAYPSPGYPSLGGGRPQPTRDDDEAAPDAGR